MRPNLGVGEGVTRRQFMRAGAGVAASAYALGSVGTLAGCSEETTSAASGTVRAVVPEGGLSRAFVEAAREFESTSDISVEILTYPYAEARQQQLLELGGGGDLDAVLIDGQIWLAELHQHLDPIDDRIDASELERFVASMPTMFQRDDATYALPFRVGGWVLIYREDLFDSAGITQVPQTWAEFRDAAERLTSDQTYGFAAPLAQTNFLVAQWLPFLWSFGGELLTGDNQQAAFNSDAGIEATTFLVDLYKDGLVPPGAIEADHDGVITAMQQGQTAMAITYSPYYLEMNSPDQSDFAGSFAVAGELPRRADSDLDTGRSMITGWGVGIARNSVNKDAAWELAEYLTRDDVQATLAIEHGNSPTVASVYRDEEYLEAYEAAGEVLDVLKGASTRPGVVEWTEIEEALALRLSEALTDSRTVAEALSAAEEDVNEALGS
ncbi:extracellular solute-binding protein [Actinobacteria bacterium YIM 96077]|uniref:Sugar ABC transporter substrate-binding protein n=1 Tax=Phytoactinopolyspora halophila TaxID=1981511 RepID=A0A329QBF2_9ACTN|nr:extracellular solute-binding protein [Phytoactinopolyspora halophila]AYY12482.1 extracellular solute-binding protein [Actinobacteria bacterium YIM 96077]RAW09321.1 hypothetical protein DPM12_21660 [Phytoactinopolyspora halophila]